MYVNHIAFRLILIIIIHRPVLSPPAYPLFNRSSRNTLRPSNYSNLQRREVNPQNPPRNGQATSTDSASTSALDDPYSANDADGGKYNEGDEDTIMVDTEAPKIDPELTQEETRKRFALYYARKDKRPRGTSKKSSWVYKYYNEAEVVPGRQYRKKRGQLVNEIKWTCRLCYSSKPHTIYESRREGVTSGQISHLYTSHKYNTERHRLGVEGLSESLVRGSQSTLSWGMEEEFFLRK